MTTALYLSSKDDATVKQELVTPSFMAMVQANTGLQVNDQNFSLQTKEELMKSIQQGKLTGNLQFGGNSFDHLVFEFQPHEDAQAISKEIVGFYSNPDYIVTKNQGGGRVQQKPVNGTREVLYDLHIKQDGTAHLHILKSHWSVNGSKINPATTCKDTYVIKAEEYHLNEHLKQRLGLVNAVSSFVSGASPNSTFTQPKASPQTKSIVNQAMQQAQTVEQYNEIVSQTKNVSVAPNLLANTLTSLDKELAELEEKKNILFETRKTVEASLVVEQNNKILERNNEILTERVEALENEKEELQAKHEEELTQKQEHIATIQERVKELEEEKEGLENDYSVIQEELEISNTDKQQVIKTLEETSIALNVANKTVEETKEQNSLYKRVIDDQYSQIEEIKRAMEEQQRAIDRQQATIKEQAEKQLQLEQDNRALQQSIEPISLKVVELATENETIKAQNSVLIEANTKLTDTVKTFTEFVDKLKTGYDKFAKTVKDKIRSMPDLKKAIEPLIKEHTELTKEVKPVIQGTKANLTEAQKKMMEIIQKKADQTKANPDSETPMGEQDNSLTNKAKPR